MITIDGKVYRNLVEQVEKNKQDIASIIEGAIVLSEFGIKIVGYVSTEEELPDASVYTGEYGDGYAVGTSSPYDYYIFTRPTDETPQAHWFNIGIFPAPGPQGPQGPQGLPGPQGESGKSWLVSGSNPISTTGYPVGSLWLNYSTGDLFLLRDNPLAWGKVNNIKGPQGPAGPAGQAGIQGPEGPQGPAGQAGPAGQVVNIIGQVDDVSSLPDPTLVKPNSAYLVGVQPPYDIYAVIGESLNTQLWINAGQFAGFQEVELVIPETATQGTLNPNQMNILLASPYNMIKVNDEYYRLNDDEEASGYLVYSHVGETLNGETLIKTLTITISTRAFVITTKGLGGSKRSWGFTIPSSGWTDALTEQSPFTKQSSIVLSSPDDLTDIDVVAYFNNAVDMAKYGVALLSANYNEGVGSTVLVFASMVLPETDILGKVVEL